MKRTKRPAKLAGIAPKKEPALRSLDAAVLEQVQGGLGADPLPTVDPSAPLGMEPQHNETLARDPHSRRRSPRRNA